MSNNRGNQSMLGSLCAPAKLYGIISLVSIAGLLVNQQVAGALGQTIFAGIWVFVLNWICGEGWTGLSWFLVVLPVIVVIMVIIGGAAALIANPEFQQQIQQQANMNRRQ
jgi:apolipoprotein N-acyltransferase